MNIIVIGSGISGLTASIRAAELGANVTLLSPYPAERSQSVMAAGGINGVMNGTADPSAIESYIEDTYKGGCCIEDIDNLRELCGRSEEHIKFLEGLGVVFNRDKDGEIHRRLLAGHSRNRTAYSGSCTGKQIVTALVQKCREYEIKGLIQRSIGLYFHSALIENNRCYGVIMMNQTTGEVVPYYGDAVIFATGGQNKLFGKTTGTEICDGYATARLFYQGLTLRNLEFIQYHPTTIETSHKRILITEGARGEGGRLYYMKDGERCYFMEELYGPKGNLKPRDVVSKCIYNCPSQVYLDVTFLGEKVIHEKLQEVYDVCLEFIGLDITKESIPVIPSVHFFMGGIDVNSEHETGVQGLYAVGECASRYHGANRLGGNCLLATVHSGSVAAESCCSKYSDPVEPDDRTREALTLYIQQAEQEIQQITESRSTFPSVYILKDIAEIMNTNLGISRSEEDLLKGIDGINQNLEILSKLHFDPDVSVYDNYRMYYLALLAKAILKSALERRETRGAHNRSDYPEASEDFRKCSYADYLDGEITISFR